MTKELSIENIKKELINKISNNSDILEVFRKREYSKDEGKCLREYGDNFIKDNYIFNHHVSDLADYISVEVDENEYLIYGNSKKEIRKSYKVSILVTLTDTSELDRISVILGDMATELYPDRYNYGNRSYIIEKQSVYGKFTQPERAIMFTIE